jgi:hypothetical protein
MFSLPQPFIVNDAKTVSNLVTPFSVKQAPGSGFEKWTVSQATAPLQGPDITFPQWYIISSPE